MYREWLQKVIGFDKWHLSSLNERPYAISTINRINELIQHGMISEGMILEVGCGLGDIISSIQWSDKMGFDIDRRAILAARILHPRTAFRVGTFDEIRNKKISALIALNFMHQINGETCCQYFGQLLQHNKVERIVIDSVQSPPYRYAHDYEAFFRKWGFALEYKSKGYVARKYTRRKILFFCRDKG